MDDDFGDWSSLEDKVMVTKLPTEMLERANPEKRYVSAGPDFEGILESDLSRVSVEIGLANDIEPSDFYPMGFGYPIIEERLMELRATHGTYLTFLKNIEIKGYECTGWGLNDTELKGEIAVYKVTPVCEEPKEDPLDSFDFD